MTFIINKDFCGSFWSELHSEYLLMFDLNLIKIGGTTFNLDLKAP